MHNTYLTLYLFKSHKKRKKLVGKSRKVAKSMFKQKRIANKKLIEQHRLLLLKGRKKSHIEREKAILKINLR